MSASNKTWTNNNAPACEDEDLNGFNLENNNLIEGSSQSLSTSDNQQTNKAVAQYAADGDFFAESGIADAYVVSAISPRAAPTILRDGLELNFVTTNASTGGAVTVNPFGLGATSVKLSGGSDPAAGDIDGRTKLVYDLGNLRFELQIFLGRVSYAKVWQEESAGTDGGTFTSGARRTRVLNTEFDPNNLLTLAANQITITNTGTYRLHCYVPAHSVNTHKAYLRNITDGADDLVSMIGSTSASNAVTTFVDMVGEVELTAGDVIEIQHQCQTTEASAGFGNGSSFGDGVEIFTTVEIWRVK